MVRRLTVGQRLRVLREAKDLTQGQLGMLMSPPVSHAAISGVERGVTHLDIERLTSWLALLGGDIAEIIKPDPPDEVCSGCASLSRHLAVVEAQSASLRERLAEAEAEIASLRVWKQESMQQIELVVGERAEALEQRWVAQKARAAAELRLSSFEEHLEAHEASLKKQVAAAEARAEGLARKLAEMSLHCNHSWDETANGDERCRWCGLSLHRAAGAEGAKSDA